MAGIQSVAGAVSFNYVNGGATAGVSGATVATIQGAIIFAVTLLVGFRPASLLAVRGAHGSISPRTRLFAS